MKIILKSQWLVDAEVLWSLGCAVCVLLYSVAARAQNVMSQRPEFASWLCDTLTGSLCGSNTCQFLPFFLSLSLSQNLKDIIKVLR